MVQMLMQRPKGRTIPLADIFFEQFYSLLRLLGISLINVQASTEKQRESVVGPNGIARSEGGSSSSFQGKLRLFVDSANVNTWRQWLPSGTFYGVTTNPILLEKAKVACHVKSLAGAKEVQLQTWGGSVKELVATGSELANIDSSIVVKIPVTKDGLEAASKLINQGARVTMTGVYSVHQVLLAAGVGASYAAPYLGRMIALGKPGLQDILEMQKIIKGVNSEMRLLVASIRSVDQLTTLAAQGVNSFAVPETIVTQLFNDPDTEKAATEFAQAVSRNAVWLFL
ncbi:unnamed protein product [Sphagnum jensenii]|uniref:Transaldolase n=1 Tax=Sphagnum jensenii TaxID=128206 RepID=A0ABP1A9F1_9BRYO